MASTNNTNPILQDSNGKPSSKRIAGFILMLAGLIFLLAIGITSIFKIIADPGTALSIGQTIIYVGGALCGIGVIEKLGNNNG